MKSCEPWVEGGKQRCSFWTVSSTDYLGQSTQWSLYIGSALKLTKLATLANWTKSMEKQRKASMGTMDTDRSSKSKKKDVRECQIKWKSDN